MTKKTKMSKFLAWVYDCQAFLDKKTRPAKSLKYVAIPILIYFGLFCFFTWPWITHFNSHFLTDTGDGLQNVWNMWWVNKSLTELHQLPWHTEFLHAPYGVTLIGQTLNPVNGFAGIVLQQVMSLSKAFNVMVIFSFVFGGLSMFWLCYYFARRYTASIIGGAVFTFSSYHFSHAIGHMQLVSLEFMPLYILLLWKLLKKPTYALAAGAALSLLMVLFSDYYYFLYSLMLSVFILGYLWWRKELPSFKKRENFLPMTVFAGLGLVLIAPLPAALLLLNKRETLLGFHDARIFSTDIATPVINGGFWRFHWLTDWYYVHIRGFISESTIYMGLSVITLFIIGLWKKTKIHKDIIFWIAVAFFFGVMSLGPRLMIGGKTIEQVPLPYIFMERLIPGLKLSGMPVRMMVMVTFSAAIVTAMVLARLKLSNKKQVALLVIFCVVFILEMWPRGLPLTESKFLPYVTFLKNLPEKGILLDNAAVSEPVQLYNQTSHEQKMTLGYVSRIPQPLVTKEQAIPTLFAEQKYDQLCTQFKIRYITTPAQRPLTTSSLVIYQDSQAIIYDLGNGSGC